MPRRATILLVDDDDADLMIAARLLRRAAPDRYRLLQAGNLEEALATLRVSPVDAILLDLNLGSTGGPATVAELRRKNEDILIVVLTGHTDGKLEEACMRAGADHFLGKSSLSEGVELMHTLEFALGSRKPKKQNFSQHLRALVSQQPAGEAAGTAETTSLAQLEDTAQQLLQQRRAPSEVFAGLLEAASNSHDPSLSLGALAALLAQAYYDKTNEDR